jgi:hypothetical protein
MKLKSVATLLLLSSTIALSAPTTRPVAATANDRVDQLIEQLGAEDFKARAAAAAQLRKLGSVALPALKQSTHADPEVQAWCAALTEQLEPKPRPDVAQLLSQSATFRVLDGGGLVRLEIEQPVGNRRVRGDLQRLVEVRQLLVDDGHLRQLREVEAEIRDLRMKLEEPINLRLIVPRRLDVLEPARNVEPEVRDVAVPR